MGLSSFGILIIDLDDFNRRLFVDINSYINWTNPLPASIYIDSIEIITTIQLNYTDTYEEIYKEMTFSQIIGVSVIIKEIGSLSLRINPDKFVQDTSNDYLTKENNKDIVPFWDFSFFSSKNISTILTSGPTQIRVFKDIVTNNNYLRVVESDIAQNSRFLFDHTITDQSNCTTIGLLDLGHSDLFTAKTLR